MLNKRVRPARPLFKQAFMPWLILFIVWLLVQLTWALDSQLHTEMLVLFIKYALLVGLIYYCVDSEKHLKLFLWTHVLGCFYLGWIVYTTYKGGRFEGFGGPDINEANAGALQVVTGILIAASLLLIGKLREKLVLFGTLPFIVNALVATISRSGF